MSTLTAQRIPLSMVALVLLVTLGGFALVGAAVNHPYAIPIYWLLIGGCVAFTWYAVKGDLLSAVLVWFITLIMLHEEFWRQPVPLFFSVTIPRIGIVVLVALFVAMVVLGRIRLRHAWPVSGVLLAIAAYFCLSAVLSGFETRSVVTVHYRLIGGYIFPFVVFVLVLHSFHAERDFRKLAVFFAGLAVYLTFTGWCEQFDVNALIWPRYISDPSVGIHWGRVRGPFVMSAAMGLTLVYCYFSNCVLARHVHRGRWLLYGLNVLMLPVIFWTKTRSVWLSFVLCSLIWAMYSRRRTTRVVSVSLLLAAGLIIAVVNMDNFMSSERAKGGLTDMEPLLLRVGLAQMTFEIVKEHPLTGIGFGHFRDVAPSFARDPSSPGYAFGTTALEHNNLLSIMAETGLIGALLYLLMIVVLLRFSIRLYRKLPAGGTGFINRDLLVLYWILTAAYFIDGTFRETSDNPFANSLFFGLSAVPVALDVLLSPRPIRQRLGFPPIRGGRFVHEMWPRRKSTVPSSSERTRRMMQSRAFERGRPTSPAGQPSRRPGGGA